MDMKTKNWHMLLTLPNGVTKSFPAESLSGLITLVAREIMQQDGRAADKEKSITIRMKNSPFTGDDESDQLAITKRIAELESSLSRNDDSTSECDPKPDELPGQYWERLESLGLPEHSIAAFYNAWFPSESIPYEIVDFNNWLKDPKAKAFRDASVNHKAYESLLPGDYESLRAYCMAKFPKLTPLVIKRTGAQ